MQEIFNAIALTQIANIGAISAKYLYDTLGSATAVMENRNNIKDVIPDATLLLTESLKNVDDAFRIAEQEVEFIEKKNIKPLCMNDEAYPQRLLNCDDAPIILYYCGNADLNTKHIISMVGTRNCSQYGKELCNSFVADLKALVPDAIIVSGLAYGIDIHSHRAALANDMSTIGVVAHGLEKIYPSVHRETASKMIAKGGILTEYIHNTKIEKSNFLKRNRIVAGISDCTIVVESGSHGGSLVTANLANAYNRDVFAFPGRISDESSAGCNKFIAENKAQLLISAEELVKTMGWCAPKPVQQDLFASAMPALTEDEQKIVDCLKGFDDKSINLVVNETGLGYGTVSAIIFELEEKGVVTTLGGARIKLNRNVFSIF